MVAIRNKFLSCIVTVLFALSGCDDPVSPEPLIHIESVLVEPSVLAVGESANLSCKLNIITDITKEGDKLSARWESEAGKISEPWKMATVWEAPSTPGDYIIRVEIFFAHQTQEAEVLVRVVQSAADGWGSISAFLKDENGASLANIEIATTTKESDTTDDDGYFYIKDIPQGITGLLFGNIDYLWAASVPAGIAVYSGSHNHLGNITINHSTPPVITSTSPIPDRRALVKWDFLDPNLYEFIDLYRSTSRDGTYTRLLRLSSKTQCIVVSNSSTSTNYYKTRAIPYYGQESDLSAYKSVSNVVSIDPDPDFSSFSNTSFFTSTLSWAPPQHEEFLQGYRVSVAGPSFWSFISDLIPIGTSSYIVPTRPGASGDYFVISITESGAFINSQSSYKRIPLSVPNLSSPRSIAGSYSASSGRVNISWDIATPNSSWHDGYSVYKSSDNGVSWQLLGNLNGVYSTSTVDSEIVSTQNYRYVVKSRAIRPLDGRIYESVAYSDTLDIMIP